MRVSAVQHTRARARARTHPHPPQLPVCTLQYKSWPPRSSLYCKSSWPPVCTLQYKSTRPPRSCRHHQLDEGLCTRTKCASLLSNTHARARARARTHTHTHTYTHTHTHLYWAQSLSSGRSSRHVKLTTAHCMTAADRVVWRHQLDVRRWTPASHRESSRLNTRCVPAPLGTAQTRGA